MHVLQAYQLPMKLSTSQVPTNIGNRGLSLVSESCLGGFGPVCQDGYGLLYCSIGDDMCTFPSAFSSYRGYLF